ncbi:hypothetical protein [Sorangium sp. So ce693]|uniref:hypothetical protein n=1 Tax=Sorangium sp. So ce693 TaxID=3133318 RepID=UPI003F5FB076
MMVLIEAEVFAGTSTADLMVLLWLGATRRHRIVVLDDQAPAYTAWLAGLDEATRGDWERVVGDGLRLNALEPSYHEVWVTAHGQSTWSYPSPTLTFGDAIDLLQRPYRLLVENGITDRAFLLSMCDRATREFLEERISREWIEAEHCGGLGELEKRVKEIRRQVAARMRCSAIFDSDAMQPGEPSPKSRAIRDLCYPDVHHHQLERRAIENYLPRAALDRWCQLAQGRARLDRRAQVEALFALRDDQRAHYNMKEGFEKDLPNAHRAGELFAAISGETRRLLRYGLDVHIANLYRDDYVHFHDLERAAVVARVQKFAREIVERIR